ncbi:pilus assembly protein TadG-related protein [Hellea sp.]|nr:pilus assembly protein TadG-related protein [Hellea sp.]
MTSLWAKYKKNINGHFAVQFALLGLPLIVATTFVADYSKAETEKVEIKSALDAAVIAAVSNNTLSASEKESYAKTHFKQNYAGDLTFDLKTAASSQRVEMSASGLSPVTVAETLGIKGIEIYENSAAEQTSENIICVLALAPTEGSSISFSGKVKFSAPTCSVHANSTDPEAIWSTRGLTPVARNFCASGGASGNYQPYAKGDCAPIADPYANKTAPAAGPCVNLGSIKDVRAAGVAGGAESPGLGGGGTTTTRELGGGGGGSGGGNLAAMSQNLTGSNVSLPPGTYCGGLTVDGQNVTFLPGNHIILDGPLTFRNGAEAMAIGVTFVMKGERSLLNIVSGSEVDVKAPAIGPLAGLAFFEDVKYNAADQATFPNGINALASGGELNVTGAVYFPTQTVEVKGNSVFGSNAPATSFIAYNVDFYGSPTINVSVDHQRAGLPPVLPRTEDGARLVQ